MTLLARALALLGIEPRDDYRRVQWPTREGRPPITLPKRLTHQEFAELRKQADDAK